MYKLNAAHLENALRLDGPHRYSYFVKRVADWGEIWTLEGSIGWVLAEDAAHSRLLPLWPHEQFAALCANGEWKEYIPARIPTKEWLAISSKRFIEDGIKAAVFPLPSGPGVISAINRMNDDIEQEISLFEDE